MLVGMASAFLSLFLINLTKLQTFTLKLEKLEFNTYIIMQNILWNVFQIITGKATFSKCYYQAHSVTITKSRGDYKTKTEDMLTHILPR